jgi:hypothetical protein
VKYHYFHSFFTDSVKWKAEPHGSSFLASSASRVRAALVSPVLRHDPLRGQLQAGSLTGAVHLSKGNAGVLRTAQRGQKPRVEQKGKCCLDPDFQYEYGPRKRGLSILLPY